MSPTTKVLVVDDMALVRRLVTGVLDGEEDIEVVGSAPDGRIALDKLGRLEVDVVILDVEMPVMDGLETLDEIRRRYPRLPVIMFSTLTERGAATTIEALSRGASDYVPKPSATGALSASLDVLRADLVPKVRLLGGRWAGRQQVLAHRSTEQRPTPAAFVRPARPVKSGPVSAVVIGVSTGGPNALSVIVPALPGDLAVPVLIVQHMPATFTRLLAERLDVRSSLHVVEVRSPLPLEPRTAYVAAGGRHLVVVARGTETWAEPSDAPPEQSCRPSVDVLFRSAAARWADSVLGVVLTGMGQDGTAGSRSIREAGGSILVQDEETSVVWGMPGAVVGAGLADGILPLPRLAAEIAVRTRRSTAVGVA